MSGIADVARAAGVSKSTASRALSGTGYVAEPTRQRVLTAASDMGFVVSSNAASLVTGRSRNVAVITPFLNRWYFAEVLDGIESALIEAGYDMTLYRIRENAEERRRVFEYFIVRKRVDAVIALNIALTPREVQTLTALGKPVVGIGGHVDGIRSLSIDDVAASRTATEHLIGLGHERIAHFGSDHGEHMDFNVQSHRLEGYLDAMDAAGLASGAGFHPTEFTIQGGYQAALTVLGAPRTRPTAIVAGCDEIAIGCIIAARELGIPIPSGLSIVGIDDHDLSPMFGLTTVRQVPSDQGVRAVGLVMRALENGDDGESSSVLPVDLVVRRSTTAPPAQ